MKKLKVAHLIIMLIVISTAVSPVVLANDYQIEKVKGNLYRFKDALNLDFDVFVGGHADVGTKSDVRRYLKYLEELYAAVIDGIHSGKTLERLKADMKLDEFSDLRNYNEWLPLNIEGVYERLMEESGMGWRPDID